MNSDYEIGFIDNRKNTHTNETASENREEERIYALYPANQKHRAGNRRFRARQMSFSSNDLKTDTEERKTDTEERKTDTEERKTDTEESLKNEALTPIKISDISTKEFTMSEVISFERDMNKLRIKLQPMMAKSPKNAELKTAWEDFLKAYDTADSVIDIQENFKNFITAYKTAMFSSIEEQYKELENTENDIEKKYKKFLNGINTKIIRKSKELNKAIHDEDRPDSIEKKFNELITEYIKFTDKDSADSIKAKFKEFIAMYRSSYVSAGDLKKFIKSYKEQLKDPIQIDFTKKFKEFIKEYYNDRVNGSGNAEQIKEKFINSITTYDTIIAAESAKDEDIYSDDIKVKVKVGFDKFINRYQRDPVRDHTQFDAFITVFDKAVDEGINSAYNALKKVGNTEVKNFITACGRVIGRDFDRKFEEFITESIEDDVKPLGEDEESKFFIIVGGKDKAEEFDKKFNEFTTAVHEFTTAAQKIGDENSNQKKFVRFLNKNNLWSDKEEILLLNKCRNSIESRIKGGNQNKSAGMIEAYVALKQSGKVFSEKFNQLTKEVNNLLILNEEKKGMTEVKKQWNKFTESVRQHHKQDKISNALNSLKIEFEKVDFKSSESSEKAKKNILELKFHFDNDNNFKAWFNQQYSYNRKLKEVKYFYQQWNSIPNIPNDKKWVRYLTSWKRYLPINAVEAGNNLIAQLSPQGKPVNPKAVKNSAQILSLELDFAEKAVKKFKDGKLNNVKKSLDPFLNIRTGSSLSTALWEMSNPHAVSVNNRLSNVDQASNYYASLDNETLKNKMAANCLLVTDGWDRLVDQLEIKKSLGFELRRETQKAYFQFINNLYHGDCTDTIKASLEDFAKEFRHDWDKMLSDPGISGQLHIFAQKILEIGKAKNDAFNEWCDSSKTKGHENWIESYDQSLRNAKNKTPAVKKDNLQEQGAIEHKKDNLQLHGMIEYKESPYWDYFQIFTANIGISAFLTLGPSKGGIDYIRSGSDITAEKFGILGTQAYHLLTMVKQGKGIINHLKLNVEGKKLKEEAEGKIKLLNEYIIKNDDSNFQEAVKSLTIAELTLAMGETMKNGGDMSAIEVAEVIIDSGRRGISSALLVMLFIGGPSAAAVPVFYGVSAGMSALAMSTSLYDCYSAFKEALTKYGFKGYMKNRIITLIKDMENDQLELEPAVKNLIKRAENDQALQLAYGFSESLFTSGFIGWGVEAGLKATEKESLIAIATAFGKAANLESGLWLLITTAFTAYHSFNEIKMSYNENEARENFQNYMHREDKNEPERIEKFNIYKTRFAKRVIKNVSAELLVGIKDFKKRQIRDNSQDENFDEREFLDEYKAIDEIAKKILDVKDEVGRQKIHPNPIAIKMDLSHTSNWNTNDFRKRAHKLENNIRALRFQITAKFVETIEKQSKWLNSAAGIKAGIKSLNHINEKNKAHYTDIQLAFLHTTMATQNLCYRIINKSFKMVKQDLEKANKEELLTIDQIKNVGRVLEEAELDLKNGKLQSAVDILKNALEDNPELQNEQQIPNLTNIIDIVSSQLKVNELLDSNLMKMNMLGQDKGQESEGGISQLAATKITNELLAKDQGALPSMMLWMLQNKDPDKAYNATVLLREMGLNERTLSTLRKMPFNKLAVNYLSWVISKPPVLGGPVKNVEISTGQDSRFKALWK
ncbi:MAG: hypothetical protein GY874_23300 [Desulfobacteraceae bacterium]|nr:hypothetical protein [Desulfobacteraceae bacterium]